MTVVLLQPHRFGTVTGGTVTGTTADTFVATATVVGTKTVGGATATSFALAATAAGNVGALSGAVEYSDGADITYSDAAPLVYVGDTPNSAAATFTLDTVAAGARTVTGTTAASFALAATASGGHQTTGTTAAPFALTATASGSVVTGAQWSDDFTSTSGLTVLVGGIAAVGGKLRSSTVGARAMVTGSTVTNSANHYSQVEVSTLTGATSEAGVGLRYDTTTNAHYLGLILPGSGGRAELYYYNGTFYTLLTSGAVTVGTLPGILRGEVDSSATNNLRLYWRGVLVLQTTHSTLTTGKPTTYQQPATAVANSELDSWGAGTLGVTAVRYSSNVAAVYSNSTAVRYT